MPTIVLADHELSQLLLSIVDKNGAAAVLKILENRRFLGYKDYRLGLTNLEHVDGTVKSCRVMISRKSKIFGGIGNKQVISLIRETVQKRYGAEGTIKNVYPRNGSIFNLTGDTVWGDESRIGYEPYNHGPQGRGESYDFIHFHFDRCYD
jgi:hypothetical protein